MSSPFNDLTIPEHIVMQAKDGMAATLRYNHDGIYFSYHAVYALECISKVHNEAEYYLTSLERVGR